MGGRRHKTRQYEKNDASHLEVAVTVAVVCAFSSWQPCEQQWPSSAAAAPRSAQPAPVATQAPPTRPPTPMPMPIPVRATNTPAPTPTYARAGNLAGRLPRGQHLYRAAMPVHLRLPGGKAGPLRCAALRFGPVVSGGTALYYRGSRLRLLPPAVADGSSIGRMRMALSVAVRRPAPATWLSVAGCRLRFGGSAIARPAPGAHLRRAAKRAIIATQPAGFAGRDRIVV